MMVTVRLGLFLLAGYLNSAHGGDQVGNGGDVVVCHLANGTIKSVEILDVYEGREYHKLNIISGEEADYKRKIDYFTKRLEKVDPTRAALVAERAGRFEKDADFKTGITLVDIPDSLHLYFPSGCKVEQIAIQKEPTSLAARRYTVSKDLWDLLDETNRAALVLHELIYREGIELGHNNSRGARLLTALILSEELSALNLSEYTKVLKKTGFQSSSFELFTFTYDTPVFFEGAQTLQSAVVKTGSLSLDGTLYELEAGAHIYFSKNGRVRRAVLARTQKIKIGKREWTLLDGRIDFTDINGKRMIRIRLAAPNLKLGDNSFEMVDGKFAFVAGRITSIREWRQASNMRLRVGPLYIDLSKDILRSLELDWDEAIQTVRKHILISVQNRDLLAHQVTWSRETEQLSIWLDATAGPDFLQDGQGNLVQISRPRFCINNSEWVEACR